METLQTWSVVLCLRKPSELDETLPARGISPGSIAATSGTGASGWQDTAYPAFDVMLPARRKALADLLLRKVTEQKNLPRC